MPLLRIAEIEDRQKGLKFLNEHPKMVEDFRTALKGLPDIEKLMSAIHSAGVRLTNHPENRAVYYELASNAKTKISRLLTCLEGLTTIEKMVHTVGARIPNEFGIRMLHSCSVLVPTIRKPNYG